MRRTPAALLLALFLPFAASASVARALEEDPPLPGESLEGWEPLGSPVQAEDVLGGEEAVALALSRHPALRMARAEIDRARGARLDARSLPNPEWEVALGPDPIEVGVGLDLTDVLLAPVRASGAGREVEAARLRLAEAEVRLGYEVRAAYAAHQAATAAWGSALRAVDALAASRDQARALEAAGNVPVRDLALREAAYEDGRQRAAAREMEMVASRERLARWIGESRPVEVAPMAPAELAIEEDIEATAVANSLEVQSLRAGLEGARRRATGARVEGFVPEVEVSVGMEREEELWGPRVGVGVTVPLFALGRGDVLQARAATDRASAELELAELAVRSAARETRDRLVSTQRRALHLQEVVVPGRERVLQETLLHYNAMQLGLDPLLDAWRARVDADIAHAEALRDLWTAKAAYDALLAGARVDVPRPTSSGGTPTENEGGH